MVSCKVIQHTTRNDAQIHRQNHQLQGHTTHPDTLLLPALKILMDPLTLALREAERGQGGDGVGTELLGLAEEGAADAGDVTVVTAPAVAVTAERAGRVVALHGQEDHAVAREETAVVEVVEGAVVAEAEEGRQLSTACGGTIGVIPYGCEAIYIHIRM